MLGPGTVSTDCSFLCYLVVTLKPKCFTTVPTGASAYLIIKLVHGHGGHGVAVGLCPIPMAVLGVNPVAGFRAELCAVLAVPVFTGVHHIHRSWPRRNPSLVWGRRRRRGLTMHSPFCKWQYNIGLKKWATYNRENNITFAENMRGRVVLSSLKKLEVQTTRGTGMQNKWCG